MKTTWRLVNDKLGRSNRKQSINKIKSFENGTLIEDPKEISDSFCSYFASASKNLLSNNIGQNLALPCTKSSYFYPTFVVTPFEMSDLEREISSLKTRNFYGSDGLTSDLFKRLSVSFKEILLFLFNKSLEAGVYPDILKIATVVALLKKRRCSVNAKLQTNINFELIFCYI